MAGALQILLGLTNFLVSAPDISESQPAGSPVLGSSTATPLGGTAPYSHSWAIVSGSGFTLSGAATATVTAQKTGTAASTVTGIVRDTVTDAVGRTAQVAISVTLENA